MQCCQPAAHSRGAQCGMHSCCFWLHIAVIHPHDSIVKKLVGLYLYSSISVHASCPYRDTAQNTNRSQGNTALQSTRAARPCAAFIVPLHTPYLCAVQHVISGGAGCHAGKVTKGQGGLTGPLKQCGPSRWQVPVWVPRHKALTATANHEGLQNTDTKTAN